MSAAHTPTPWQVANGSPLLIGCDGFWIAGMMGLQGEIGEANARFIVRAVNCHDQLVEALENYMFAEEIDDEGVRQAELAVARQDACAALAKALGRTPNSKDVEA